MRKMMRLVVLLLALGLSAQETNPVVIVNLSADLQKQLTEAITPAIDDLSKVMGDCQKQQAIVMVIPDPVRLQIIGQCLDEEEKQPDIRRAYEKSNR